MLKYNCKLKILIYKTIYLPLNIFIERLHRKMRSFGMLFYFTRAKYTSTITPSTILYQPNALKSWFLM